MLAQEMDGLAPIDTPYNGLAIGANVRGDYEEGRKVEPGSARGVSGHGEQDSQRRADGQRHPLQHGLCCLSSKVNTDRASPLAEDALAMQRKLSFTWAASDSLFLLARIAEKLGHGTEATALYRESLSIRRRPPRPGTDRPITSITMRVSTALPAGTTGQPSGSAPVTSSTRSWWSNG